MIRQAAPATAIYANCDCVREVTRNGECVTCGSRHVIRPRRHSRLTPRTRLRLVTRLRQLGRRKGIA